MAAIGLSCNDIDPIQKSNVMTRTPKAILSDIVIFAPYSGDWRALESLLNELWATGVGKDDLPTLFRVFERYPSDDGAGVLWSIVHGVEALPFSYEQPLRESLSKHPSFMGKVMVQRLERERRGSAGSSDPRA